LPEIDDPDMAMGTHWSTMRTGQRRSVLIGVALLVLAAMITLNPVLPAIGWGAIIALSLWPWRTSLTRRWPGRERWLIPGLMTLVVFLAFVGPVVVIISSLAREVSSVTALVAQTSIEGFAAPEFLHKLPMGGRIVGWWNDNLAEPGALGEFLHRQEQRSHISLGAGGRILGAALHRVLLIAFMLLTLFFVLRDGEALVDGLEKGGQRAFGFAGERVGLQIVEAVRGTVNGMVVVGVGQGLLLGIAYAMAGVPYAVLFGLLSGFLSVIPYAGLLPLVTAVVLLLANNALGPAIAVASFAAVVIFIADHFVRPALIGNATRLPFPIVLFGVVGGIETWGLIGLVLGPALMAALTLLWREWIGTQQGPFNQTDQSLSP
jgi:predicted PurR-regulated permease PerM